MTIERPALRYYGGKFRLAPWIISHFPQHDSYVEPCGGAGSILLLKERSPLETFNDLDGQITNFFRVIRDRRDELIEKIEFTPWSRLEYDLVRLPCDDELESARRVYMWLNMAISASRRYRSGMRMVKNSEAVPAQQHINTKHLYDISRRLMGVQIEGLPAIECIQRYDTPNTLTYFDPPYLMEGRTSGKEYMIEADEQFHIDAAELLNQSQGYVIVSGYTSELYRLQYEVQGWSRLDQETQTNGEKRVESIWLNPKLAYILAKQQETPSQLNLFG